MASQLERNTLKTCDRKILYDTEFEAERASSIMSRVWGDEMIPYQCGRHWHIAHKDPSLWGKAPVKLRNDWCHVCDQPINPKRYWKHILKQSHIDKEKAPK